MAVPHSRLEIAVERMTLWHILSHSWEPRAVDVFQLKPIAD
jgi:hypothetical protein